MDSVPCEACGCTEYTQHSGFYICNNCDTQSQRIEVQHFESFRRDFDDREIEEVRSEKSLTDRKLTSWECYNLLLSGLVDELIDLGASKQIRVYAFQLWASYLQWSDVAFTSKTEEKVPALPIHFRNKDAEILYGIRRLKPRLLKTSNVRPAKPKRRKRKIDDSASESVSVASSKSIKMKRRKMAIDESMSKSEYERPEVETLESLEKERESKRILKQNIVFQSSTRKLLKEIVGPKRQPTKDPAKLREHLRERRQKVITFMYDKKSPSASLNSCLSTITVLAILRIALQLANDEIFLADIFRWISEGRLSVLQPEKIVPSFSALVQQFDLKTITRQSLLRECRNLTFKLKISDLPTPNLFKLAERYCTELCLPDDLLKLVLKLMVVSNVKMDYKKYNFRIFPDYECRVMAFILFAFKLLFSLNDITEFQQSDFADTVNKLQQSQTIDKIPKLFSWNSWKKFVECRKSVLSCYDAPISELTRYQKYCEEDVFLNRWEKVQSIAETKKEKIHVALKSALCQEVASLLSENVQNNDGKKFVDCPASLTPWTTLTEHILKHHSDSLPSKTREILSGTFKTDSIKYATDLNWCSDLAKSLKIEIKPCSLDDQLDWKLYDKSAVPFSAVKKPDPVPPDCYVPVLLCSAQQPTKGRIRNVLSRFDASIYQNDTESASQSEKNDLKIHEASPYWLFLHKRAFWTSEFLDLAQMKFPRSFVWLLCECATILRSDAKILYLELLVVERQMRSLYGTTILRSHHENFKSRIDEW